METKTPFMFKGGEGINAGVGEVEWVIAKDRYKYDAMFDTLNPIDGKVSGASAKSELETRDCDSDISKASNTTPLNMNNWIWIENGHNCYK